MARYMGAEVQMHNAYHLQPFHRVYLHSRADYSIDRFGDIGQLYVFGHRRRVYSRHCLRELHEFGNRPNPLAGRERWACEKWWGPADGS